MLKVEIKTGLVGGTTITVPPEAAETETWRVVAADSLKKASRAKTRMI